MWAVLSFLKNKYKKILTCIVFFILINWLINVFVYIKDELPINTIVGMSTVATLPNKIFQKVVGLGSSLSGVRDDGGDAKIANPIPKFRLDPHFDLTIYSNLIPTELEYLYPKVGVGLSLFSYGLNSNDNSWRFIRFGVGGWTNTGIDLTLSPLMYNFGRPLPILTNTWIYPYVGYNVNHNKYKLGIGLSISF